jgi:hypothetical protein
MWFRKKGCSWVEEVLSEYLNHNLSPEDMERVGHHLTQCQRCREGYEYLKLTVGLVRSVSLVPAPRSFAIQPILQAERRPLRAVFLRPVALSAVAVLALALFYVIPENSKEGHPTSDEMMVVNPSPEDVVPLKAAPLSEVELSLSRAEKLGTPAPESLAGGEIAPPHPTSLLSEGMETSPPTHPLPSRPALEPGDKVPEGVEVCAPPLCLPCIGRIA